MSTLKDRAERLFAENFRARMRGGSIEAFRRSFSTLYNQVIMPTIVEMANETHPVHSIEMDFITNSLDIGLAIANSPSLSITDVNPETKLRNLYFVGQGLCLDVEDEDGDLDVISVNWSDKRFGLFSGGPRVELSDRALEKLQALMDKCGINYKD